MRAPVPFQRRATSRWRRSEVTNGTIDGATASWIMSRICEALDQADVARATASNLDDHVLVSATIRLAEDLEAFALSLAGRLSELRELPGGGDRVSQRGRSSA
jgi:hypothetical protein